MSSKALDIISFELGGRHFGVAASDIEEIVLAVVLLPLPGESAGIEGLMQVRGTTVPVLDIRRRLSLPPKPLRHTDHIVIANSRGHRFGWRVDRATGLLHLKGGEIEWRSEDETVDMPYLSGVVKLAEAMLILLDAQELFMPAATS